MKIVNFLKVKLYKLLAKLDILEFYKIDDIECQTGEEIPNLSNDIKIEHKIKRANMIGNKPEEQVPEVNLILKEKISPKTLTKEDIEFRNKVFDYDYYNSIIDNSRFEKYSMRVVEEPELNNIFYEVDKKVKHIESGCVNIFEQLEVDYFEELEKCETQLGDVIKFRYRSFEEIGLEAENMVHMELEKLEGNLYMIAHNILLRSYNGNTTQIDSLIISIYGIFVIETKNYKGTIVGSEDSVNWQCHYKTTFKKSKFKKPRKEFYNPIKQNSSHISYLKAFLKLYTDVPFYSVIVFSEEAIVNVETSTHVVRICDLIGLIKKYTLEVVSESLMKEIYNKILDNNIVDIKIAEDHKEYVRNIHSEKRITSLKTEMRLDHLITLYLTPGIGTRTIEYVKDNLDSEISSVDDILTMLLRVKKISSKISVPSIKQLQLSYEKALDLITYNKQQGITLTSYFNKDYPKELMNFPSYPMLVFSIGNLACLKDANKIGILGSNKSTVYANRCAERFGEVCANNNIIVVSILDEGCNLWAAKGALSQKGKVILVVPAQLKLTGNKNLQLYNEIINNKGCVISCIESNGLQSDYRRNQLNEFFVGLCINIIAIEVYSNPKIIDIVKLAFADKRKIAYLDQSKELHKKEIDKEAKLMASFGAMPLKNKYDLEQFLKI